MRTLATFLALSAVPALAQEVAPCDWRASSQALVEPWEDTSRTFANGAVRLAVLDTIEPAVGAMHLLVLSPPYDDFGGRQCRVVSHGDQIGFAAMDFDTLTATYYPDVGLNFSIQVRYFDPARDDMVSRTMLVTVNQATGDLIAHWDKP